jgi:hypothetical protein
MKIIYFVFTILLLSGCTSSSPKVKEFFQTDNATHIQNDYKKIVNLLIQYKKKLDLRNPQNYDKQFSYHIYNELNKSTNYLFLKKGGKYIKDYNKYLNTAFQADTKLRNDYLILGLYKQIWFAYEQDKTHNITTLTYDKNSLKTLFYTLKVLKWKINSKKDMHGNYFFLTWQNNWQIELKKLIDEGEKPTWERIKNLKHIKSKQESLFSPSNPNFEILMSEMIFRVENSLEIIGEEPLDMSIEAMKSLVFFL